MYLQYNEYNSISRKNSRKKREGWIEKHHNNQNSVQFSCSVVSDSLWPQGLQQARPPCPSPTPSVYSNSCPLSWWYHPTISSSPTIFWFTMYQTGEGMATHSSVLAWRIPGTGESGGLPSLGSHRVGHDWSNLTAAAADCKKDISRF